MTYSTTTYDPKMKMTKAFDDPLHFCMKVDSPMMLTLYPNDLEVLVPTNCTLCLYTL